MNIVVHTDGGARGNPGPAAIGIVIEQGNSKTIQFGKKIGKTTNNVAEYSAVIEALMYIKLHLDTPALGSSQINLILFYLDSTLVVNQLNGIFKVKDARLREFLSRIRILEQEISVSIQYHVIPREQNRRADRLVNQALDSKY